MPTGHIVFFRGGTPWAVGFDLNVLEITGKPSPVIEGITVADRLQLPRPVRWPMCPQAVCRRLVSYGWIGLAAREVIATPPGG